MCAIWVGNGGIDVDPVEVAEFAREDLSPSREPMLFAMRQNRAARGAIFSSGPPRMSGSFQAPQILTAL